MQPVNESLAVVYGGARIGDTIAAISAIRALSAEYQLPITWIHGTFTNSLFGFFQHTDLPIETDISLQEERTPSDYTDVASFNLLVRNTMELNAKVIKFFIHANRKECLGPHLWQRAVADLQADPKLAVPPHLSIFNSRSLRLGYICVQCDSISNWKQMSVLSAIKFPLPVISLGLPGELILPKSEDARSSNFTTTAGILNNCNLFVGINSALSHLSAALGKPTIQLSPRPDWPKWNGTEAYHSKCFDLCNPSAPQLLAAIERLLAN